MAPPAPVAQLRHSAAIAAHLPSAADSRDQKLLRQFAALFWSKSPESEQLGRSAEDDLLLSMDCYRRLNDRKPTEIEVSVDNPDLRRDGWSSDRTVIRVFAPDMPFVIDSLLMALTKAGQSTLFLNNVVFHITRDRDGGIRSLEIDRQGRPESGELVALVEVDRMDDAMLETLRDQILDALADVRAAVNDFPAMRWRLLAGIERLEKQESTAPVREAIDFLRWLADNHFTFLGYREFTYGDDTIQQVPGSAMGILHHTCWIWFTICHTFIRDDPYATRTFCWLRCASKLFFIAALGRMRLPGTGWFDSSSPGLCTPR
ncbi:MAG: NAD-glutamate dehydrogenase [Gammaproteobacteria bacterium]|nr:NAD-glutamate dehydrogenase [Gammaproteobacteria bacterium]